MTKFFGFEDYGIPMGGAKEAKGRHKGSTLHGKADKSVGRHAKQVKLQKAKAAKAAKAGKGAAKKGGWW